jgi:hypothetical protein
MRKAVTTIVVLTALLFGFAACEGSYIDPNLQEMGGGYGSGGYGGGGEGWGTGYPGGTGGTGGTGGGTGGGGGGIPGATNGWPPSSVRNQYGIGGLNQPPGSKFSYEVGTGSEGTSGLVVWFTPTDATPTYLNNWFTSNWSESLQSLPNGLWVKAPYGAMYNHYYPATGGAYLGVSKENN